MPLAPGTRIGSYEVLAPLGAGGMGEVYRASDLKLGRQVALKVLPPELARDPDRYARFQREAHALAALNHPNIAAIYGLEDNALVMELVDGETLPTPLPVETAVAYAKQIAEALEYAHDRNIIHRDLKPANIMITRDGVVKVLDFGLAKVAEPAPAADPANSPTLTMGKTEVGLIMGTASYMSPEQAAGKTVDKRSDIWSFGVVLWEMITGRMLFAGETVSHTLADVLRAPIDLDAVTPKPLREIIARCLVREPKNRMRDIGEARLALANLREEPPTTTAKPSWIPWAIAAAALIAASAGWWQATRPAEKSLVDLELTVPAEQAAYEQRSPIAISPDGSKLVYSRQSVLWLRRLDRSAPQRLAGTEGGFAPFFSPDGKSIGFFANGKLNTLVLDGGLPVSVCDAPNGRGGTWSAGGTIIFTPENFESALMKVPAAGGTPVLAATLDKSNGERTMRWPQFLEASQAVLFNSHTAFNGFDQANLSVVSLSDGRRKTLIKAAAYARYVPGGPILFVRDGALYSIGFDAKRLEITGPPVRVQGGIRYSTLTGAGQFDAAANGTLIYEQGGGRGITQTVHWLDLSGARKPLLQKPAVYSRMRFSPDGARMIMVITEGAYSDIWLYDLKRETLVRLTNQIGNPGSIAWHPKGDYVMYSALEGIVAIRADGGGTPAVITGSKGLLGWQISDDGATLATASPTSALFSINGEPGNWSLRPIRKMVGENATGPISKNGKWMATVPAGAGESQVVVASIAAGGGRWQVTTERGSAPQWGADGKSLFYRSLIDSTIKVLSFESNGDIFIPGKTREIAGSNIGFGTTRGIGGYAVHPDGKRLAILVPEDQGTKSFDTLRVLLNFQAPPAN